MSDSPARPGRGARAETREVAELRALKERNPDLAGAVDMHIELLELQRRVQSRISLPWFDLAHDRLAHHIAEGRPLVRFEEIPIELTDLRLLVRQTADVLRRHGALDEADHTRIQQVGRDMKLLEVAAAWYRRTAENHVVAAAGIGGLDAHAPEAEHAGMLDQVLVIAMRPFLARCAEVLQPRAELAGWMRGYCPVCGAEPDLSVITPAAERHLICGRCAMRWKFEPLSCPFCNNSDRSRITSFATPDGHYRVFACDACQRYLKAYDGRRASRPVMPLVDALATLPLDAAAMQRGYSG